MDTEGQWCLIESDPGLFTDMIRNFGVSGVQVEEMYALDKSLCSELQPVYGLIFLFKYRGTSDTTGTPCFDESIFFAQQVITNACATQAIVNMLLNVDNPNVKLGEILTDFKNFSADFRPADRGLALSNAERIRAVHNSYGRSQLYDVLQPASKGDDVFHFVSYVPIRGKIYELDGLCETPIEVGTIPEGIDWMDVVRPIISDRMTRYSEGEIHFNLMAVVRDRKEKIQEQLEILGESADPETVSRLTKELELEHERDVHFKLENRRRRFNYIPYIVQLLRVLAREGKLVPIIEEVINEEKEKNKSARKIAKQLKADA